ncbi:exodeoxyribonuclease III [Variibacter gotjawalensis]|uniref:Exodeoxyribonuclease III n=1 Tax=Variibacter gotjawalensis TaxID=1333996 RepID=A0A0S3PSE1_9BRAD|nr:exodeoxyribonuclease III [Variibacter gotjawalensis]NIK49164.1 exodeoxyribonuclease-3 [Variibacter gotjawalensis]RZS51020.1 exodeoxyribonuclease-3 [Variibacter gotjawalensis]BAT58854.1 exodeoxyribonuclease III [Variibacter gotjawalensis]
MKVATFNINNINKRLTNLLAWLKAAKPDVVCLQELKAEQKQFPDEALRAAGYEAVWAGQKSWNGVAILARKHKPVVTQNRLPGDASDKQSRYIEAAVDGVLIACVYAPNGNPQPGPKFKYKLAWMKRLHTHAAALLKTGAPVIIAGDFNVAPTEIDIYPTKSWNDDALIQPEPRKAFERLVAQGWTDALRAVNPDKRIYTFWTYWRNRYERDDGLRLDHFLLSPDVAQRLKKADVDRAIRGLDNASDHAPAWITLK